MDTSTDFNSPDIGPICDNCTKIFQGEHHMDATAVLIAAPVINSTRPQQCRLCSVICSRHRRFSEMVGGLGKTPECLRVTYYLSPMYHKSDPFLEVRLELHYDIGRKCGIRFAMARAGTRSRNMNRSIQCQLIILA